MHLMDLLHNLGITDVSLNGWDVRVNFSESCDKRLTPIYSNHRLHSSVTESHSSNANPSTEFNQVPKVGSGAPAVKKPHHHSRQPWSARAGTLATTWALKTVILKAASGTFSIPWTFTRVPHGNNVPTTVSPVVQTRSMTASVLTPTSLLRSKRQSIGSPGVPPKSHGNQKRGDRKHSPFACAAHPLAGLVSLSLNKKCLKPPTSNQHNWGATSSDASLIWNNAIFVSPQTRPGASKTKGLCYASAGRGSSHRGFGEELFWEWLPLLTMIPVRSQWGRYNML